MISSFVVFFHSVVLSSSDPTKHGIIALATKHTLKSRHGNYGNFFRFSSSAIFIDLPFIIIYLPWKPSVYCCLPILSLCLRKPVRQVTDEKNGDLCCPILGSSESKTTTKLLWLYYLPPKKRTIMDRLHYSSSYLFTNSKPSGDLFFVLILIYDY